MRTAQPTWKKPRVPRTRPTIGLGSDAIALVLGAAVAATVGGCGGGGGGGGGVAAPLELSGIIPTFASDSEVVIAWSTSVRADGQVEYGATPAYGSVTPLDDALVTSHEVRIAALTPLQTYHFRVLSRDRTGTLVASDDATFGGPSSGGVGACPVFPADSPWNQDISGLPVHPDSAALIARIQSSGGTHLHADFGGGGAYGIPFVSVPGTEPLVEVEFTAYGDESDPGPYPVPLSAPIEGGAGSGGDRHVIAVDRDNCVLYELYRAFPRSGRWEAASGAVFDLLSNDLRPLGWTSADAAGLPIFAGLARYDEVASGEVRHALRVTFSETRRGYILPATHFASSSADPDLPPMGLRLRLQAGFDLSGFTGQSRTILEALKRYGLIVADNGSNWFISGASDARWDDEDLNQLKTVPGDAFEAVDTGPIRS